MDPVSIALGLAQFAPTLMRFFGVGDKPVAVAEKVVEIAQGVTGKQDPAAALEAMRQNAELANDFNKAVLAANTDLEKACLADRQSARDREVRIATSESAPFLNKIITPVLALVVVGATFGMFWWMVDSVDADINPSQKDIIIYVLGVLSAISTQVIAYYFGSSVGSTAKDQTIKRILKDG